MEKSRGMSVTVVEGKMLESWKWQGKGRVGVDFVCGIGVSRKPSIPTLSLPSHLTRRVRLEQRPLSLL